MASKKDPRKKFDDLRAMYLAARQKLDEQDSSMRARYGGGYQESWLRAGERTAMNKLRGKASSAGDAFFEHLQAISPRDWSYGVPVHWLYEDLSYEDAVRPIGEALSVVPPLSYGSSVHRT